MTDENKLIPQIKTIEDFNKALAELNRPIIPLTFHYDVIVMFEDEIEHCSHCDVSDENAKFCKNCKDRRCGFVMKISSSTIDKVKSLGVSLQVVREFLKIRYSVYGETLLAFANTQFSQLEKLYDSLSDEERLVIFIEEFDKDLYSNQARFDDMIRWLGCRGYRFDPKAEKGLRCPNGTEATFNDLVEELYEWLKVRRGHTGVDDFIKTIAMYKHGAPLGMLGHIIGSRKNGLIAEIFKRAENRDLPNRITKKEAKTLGYSYTQLLQMGYKEIRINGRRFLEYSESSCLLLK